MSKYNLEKLIKISVFVPQESAWYTFEEGRKSFWRGTVKRGIYDFFQHYKGESIDNHFVKDGKVYEYAECVLYFQDEYKFRYYFKTVEEARVKSQEIQELFSKQFGRPLVDFDKF